jgi:hypothetical protein
MNAPIVAYMSVDGRLIAAANRDKTSSASVAQRYSRPLIELAKSREAVAELVEALQGMVGVLEPAEGDFTPQEQIAIDTARAAIAKATGATP